jgi:hypothetical protein
MRQRHERLLRLARFLETTTKVTQARIGALQRADRNLAQRYEDLLDALNRPGPCQFLFADAAARRIASLARERNSLAYEIASESERLRAAEIRSRATQHAIDGLRATLVDREQRGSLEALGADLAQASASRKAPDLKV